MEQLGGPVESTERGSDGQFLYDPNLRTPSAAELEEMFKRDASVQSLPLENSAWGS